jgi:prepilin-type processing-associated H-X9-DG protein
MYLAVVGPSSCLQPAVGRKMAEISDSTMATLIVVDIDEQHAVPWISPQDATEQQVLAFAESKSLSHPGGMQALFADANVRFLGASIKPALLRAMISAAGGEDEVLLQSE